MHRPSYTQKCHQVRGPKWNCLKLHLCTPIPHRSPCAAPFRIKLASIEWSLVQFLQARPSLSSVEGGAKEGREGRDSSIVWLPPGCATGTWTRFNRTRSTAATEVPKSPRLKNGGVLINYNSWLVHVNKTHSLIRLRAHKSNLFQCVRGGVCWKWDAWPPLLQQTSLLIFGV